MASSEDEVNKMRELTIFLMLAVELEMPVTVVGVVELVQVGDLCKEWTWVLCQRMEVESVCKEDEGLGVSASFACISNASMAPPMPRIHHGALRIALT